MLGSIKHRLSERRRYASTKDWGLTVYHRVISRLKGFPLPGVRRPVRVRPLDAHAPLAVRLATSDVLVMEEIFLHNEYGDAIAACTSPVRLVVDLGGNVGLSTRLWLQRFPDARVVVVEPVPENCAMIRRNVDLVNAQSRVALVEACVGDTEGTVHIRIQAGEEWAARMDAQGNLAVPCHTLDHILASANVAPDQPIDLLKCDIEGAESALFANTPAWLARVRTMVVETHGDYTVDRLMRDVGPAGFANPRVLKQNPSVAVVLLTRQPRA